MFRKKSTSKAPPATSSIPSLSSQPSPPFPATSAGSGSGSRASLGRAPPPQPASASSSLSASGSTTLAGTGPGSSQGSHPPGGRARKPSLKRIFSTAIGKNTPLPPDESTTMGPAEGGGGTRTERALSWIGSKRRSSKDMVGYKGVGFKGVPPEQKTSGKGRSVSAGGDGAPGGEREEVEGGLFREDFGTSISSRTSLRPPTMASSSEHYSQQQFPTNGSSQASHTPPRATGNGGEGGAARTRQASVSSSFSGRQAARKGSMLSLLGSSSGGKGQISKAEESNGSVRGSSVEIERGSAAGALGTTSGGGGAIVMGGGRSRSASPANAGSSVARRKKSQSDTTTTTTASGSTSSLLPALPTPAPHGDSSHLLSPPGSSFFPPTTPSLGQTPFSHRSQPLPPVVSTFMLADASTEHLPSSLIASDYAPPSSSPRIGTTASVHSMPPTTTGGQPSATAELLLQSLASAGTPKVQVKKLRKKDNTGRGAASPVGKLRKKRTAGEVETESAESSRRGSVDVVRTQEQLSKKDEEVVASSYEPSQSLPKGISEPPPPESEVETPQQSAAVVEQQPIEDESPLPTPSTETEEDPPSTPFPVPPTPTPSSETTTDTTFNHQICLPSESIRPAPLTFFDDKPSPPKRTASSSSAALLQSQPLILHLPNPLHPLRKVLALPLLPIFVPSWVQDWVRRKTVKLTLPEVPTTLREVEEKGWEVARGAGTVVKWGMGWWVIVPWRVGRWVIGERQRAG